MSWLKDGRGNLARKRARNFTHETAQKRLDETLDPFRNQIDNALQVDSTEVIVFKRVKVGRPCTCQKVEATPTSVKQEDGCVPPVLAPQGSKHDGVQFDFMDDNDLGEGLAERALPHGDTDSSTGSSAVELGDMLESGMSNNNHFNEEDEERERYEENLFGGSNVNCGICFREGYQPPFEPVGYKYYTLTNYDMINVSGMHVDISAFPAEFQPTYDGAFVDFEILVPKFYTEAKMSIRNNTAIVKHHKPVAVLADTEVPITKALLDQHRGKTLVIRIKLTENFTHVNVFFNEGLEPVLGSISEEAEQLNYNLDLSVGNLTIVLPSRIGKIDAGDILVIPDRQLTLKVSDAPRKQTVKRERWEWALSTRTLQKAEPLRYIFTGYKIY